MEQHEPRVIILVGIPGSGKSTYAKNELLGLQNVAYINQDTLGSRQKCIQAFRDAVNAGALNFVIDRTNINRQQRKYWIDLGKEFNMNINVVEFKCETEECIKRIMKRKDHKTIKNIPESKVREIVNKFVNAYEVPNAINEGFSSHICFYDDNSNQCENDQSVVNRQWSGNIPTFITKLSCRLKSLFR